MQRHAEGHTSRRVFTGECHRPWQRRWLTPAASRRETSQPSDAMPDCDSGREQVSRREQRKLLPPHIKIREYECRNEAAVKNPRALQGLAREDLAWMQAILRVERNHQNLGAQHADESAVHSQIHHTFRI